MADDKDIFGPKELPWPEKGDRLFQSGDDWWHNACLNYDLDDWELYIKGYKRAGDVMADYIKQTTCDQDSLIFPIVFVYRQYLELRLKVLIKDCRELFDEPSDYMRGHALGPLWAECKRLLKKLEPKISMKDFEAVDEGIQQFIKLDPGSTAFRYPISASGDKSLPADLKYINIRNLAEVMDKLSGFFESGEMMVSVYLDYKHGMEHDLGNLYG
jgi:hypothetical protein